MTAAPSSSSALSLAAERERILEALCRAAADGAQVDLAGFEDEAGRLCIAAGAVPAAEREAAAAALGKLIGALDRLRTELLRQHERTGNATREAGRRAARAYGTSTGGPG